MWSELNTQVKKLLLSHTIFLLGRSAFQIFMSVFVWRLTDDISIVAWFSIIYILAHTSVFVFLNDALRRGRTHRVRKIGLIGFSLVYLSLFILQGEVKSFLYLYAVLIGIFNGMYWLPYHVNRFNFTHIKNRGNYTGLERASKTIVSFIAPVAGGYIISSQHFFGGYPSLFMIGTIFFFLSFLTGNVEVPIDHKLKKFSWAKTTKNVLSNPKVLKSNLAVMLGGFSLNGSLISVILPLLILQKTNTEFQLGSWLSVFALLSILSSLVLGRWISYLHYDRSVIVGGLTFIILFGLIYIYPVFAIFILFGAVQEIAANMINIPRRVYSENLMHTLPNFEENKVAYLVIREVFGVGIGMTASYLLLIFTKDLSTSGLTAYVVLIILGVFAQMALLLSVKYKDENFDFVELAEK